MLKIYNSNSKSIEDFIPINQDKVNMYVCGPTVYDHIHIGNARPVIVFDMLKDYLNFIGYQVRYASNITDIDDKIISKAQQLNTSEKTLTDQYTKAFFAVCKLLNAKVPDDTPHATTYVNEMINQIKQLIELDFAYVVKSGIYFRVNHLTQYGSLSGQSADQLLSSVRITNQSDKENPLDFALWKFSTEGLSFSSPWGQGRPGWHLECAAITKTLFPKGLDIHGGGVDLKFPHHENEIACNKPLGQNLVAKYWLHVGRINLGVEKMSKSLGNTIILKDLLTQFSGLTLRYYMLSYHYRQPFEYNIEVLTNFSKKYDKILSSLNRAYFILLLDNNMTNDINQEILSEFTKIMNDDLNTPNVMTLIDTQIKELNKQPTASILNALVKVLTVLGLNQPFDITDNDISNYHHWQEARQKKDYQSADHYRNLLAQKGLI